MNMRVIMVGIFTAVIVYPSIVVSLPPPIPSVPFDLLAKGDQLDKPALSAYLFSQQSELSQIDSSMERKGSGIGAPSKAQAQGKLSDKDVI